MATTGGIPMSDAIIPAQACVSIIQAYERGFRHIIVDDSWPIECVIGCGWPPLPSVDMVMNNPLAPGEQVRWVES
jgi:hypothetical protein